MLVIDCVGQTWFFGRSRKRADGGTGHMGAGSGTRCIRKTSFVRGTPPKTGVVDYGKT